MSDLPSLRLRDAWQHCERHLHHLCHALGAIQKSLPMTAEKLAMLDDEAVQDWDQLILRFTKLQDTMGTRLFPLQHLKFCKSPTKNAPWSTSCSVWRSWFI
jgi:hypothetical protein